MDVVYKKRKNYGKMAIIETKEKIKSLNSENLGALILENRKDNTYIKNILENLGHLPQNFDGN